jgi:nicotinate-nucleotide adenylyltransferase
MQRWGLMGGTFDPIHLAHLRCAQEILEKYGLDRIIFIPSATPPLKQGPGITSYEHRERMVRFAVEGNPAFASSDVENRREGRSYTVDTIGYFRETFGKELEIYFIMGQDAFEDIQRWKSWRRLLTLCHFIIMTRPGWRKGSLRKLFPPMMRSASPMTGKRTVILVPRASSYPSRVSPNSISSRGTSASA